MLYIHRETLLYMQNLTPSSCTTLFYLLINANVNVNVSALTVGHIEGAPKFFNMCRLSFNWHGDILHVIKIIVIKNKR
jgi:hypothetical protein